MTVLGACLCGAQAALGAAISASIGRLCAAVQLMAVSPRVGRAAAQLMAVSPRIGREAALVGCAFLLGLILSIAYDILRILRRLVPQGKWRVGISDTLFWLCAAVALFLLFYFVNDGSLRAFALFFAALAVVLYYGLCSRLVLRGGVFFLKKLFFFLFWPFQRLKKVIKYPINKIISRMRTQKRGKRT